MKLNIIVTLLAAGFAVSCASNAPYHPASRPERIEYRYGRFDVYPEDVRKNPTNYAGLTVVWAGIIRSSDTQEEQAGGLIRVNSVIEHHYFHWRQDEHPEGVKLLLSPRGEGLFRIRWHLRRNDPEASGADAAAFVAPGRLAIVYGVPESVDDDGTVVLKYHYARLLGREHYATNETDYGRLGEPFYDAGARPKTGSTP